MSPAVPTFSFTHFAVRAECAVFGLVVWCSRYHLFANFFVFRLSMISGGGKSHTLATILENLLIPKFNPIGSLEEAMSALVLHFGEGGTSSLPSEVTWLGSISKPYDVELPKVRVFVSPSSVKTMCATYKNALGDKVEVYPLHFTQAELDAAAILSMMSISSPDQAPLYMHLVLVSHCVFDLIEI